MVIPGDRVLGYAAPWSASVTLTLYPLQMHSLL